MFKGNERVTYDALKKTTNPPMCFLRQQIAQFHQHVSVDVGTLIINLPNTPKLNMEAPNWRFVDAFPLQAGILRFYN